MTGDIATQTRRVFGNIGAVLRAAGMDYGDLASCTVFMDDPREFGDMNEAYREFFQEDPPARARAVVHATTHWDEPVEVLNASRGLREAMPGIAMETLAEHERLANRGW